MVFGPNWWPLAQEVLETYVDSSNELLAEAADDALEELLLLGGNLNDLLSRPDAMFDLNDEDWLDIDEEGDSYRSFGLDADLDKANLN